MIVKLYTGKTLKGKVPTALDHHKNTKESKEELNELQ